MSDKEFVLPAAEENGATKTREAIAQMSGFSSFEEVGNATPEQGALPGIEVVEKKKRGRKPGSKNKTSSASEESIDPLMYDKKYADAVGRMAAFGGSKVIETAFSATGAPLDAEEKSRVEDLSYVAAKKYNLDPSQSPLLMAIYTIVLLTQLILVRIYGTTSGEMWKHFQGLFNKKDENSDEKNND